MSVSVSSLLLAVICTWPTTSWSGTSSKRSVACGSATSAGGAAGGGGTLFGWGFHASCTSEQEARPNNRLARAMRVSGCGAESMLSIMTSACAALQQHRLVGQFVAARAAHAWKMALQKTPDLQNAGD